MITSAKDFEILRDHVGHQIVCVIYNDQEVSIECEDCNEVLYSVNEEEEEDQKPQSKPMLLTNFPTKQRESYEKMIAEFNDSDIYISENAYNINDYRIKGYNALMCIRDKDQGEFWNFFRNFKIT